MAVLAKGTITLTSVSDAYSVSLTNDTCIIPADYDGSNPQLGGAETIVSVLCGEILVPVTVDAMEIKCLPENGSLVFAVTQVDEYHCRIAILDVKQGVTEGYLEIPVHFSVDSVINARLLFSVIRQSTMLDWIQDWESNKTQIGGEYVITPRLFAGKKESDEDGVERLTGVYMGPDDVSAGLYGYKLGECIFSLSEYGGMIGGWSIFNGGIQSEDGALGILSSGEISATIDGIQRWGLFSDGSATFACGNVTMSADGDVTVKGHIEAKTGLIGNWDIVDGVLKGDSIVLDAERREIAVICGDTQDGQAAIDTVRLLGGVAMYYSDGSNYGIAVYKGDTATFLAGSTNCIAGWNFDDNALWKGDKVNSKGEYTADGDITIGDKGIRGNSWYLDSDNGASFCGGLVGFDKTQGTLMGWLLTENRMSTNHAAIISHSDYTGIYLAADDISNVSMSGLAPAIDKTGGIYMCYVDGVALLAAKNTEGKTIFQLQNSGDNKIGSWTFDERSLYTSQAVYSGFTSSGNITISAEGIRGAGWRFEADGSGAVANGNIAWTDKEVTFSSQVKISWDNLGDTVIDKDGVFAGKVSADNISAGTISTADITNKDESWKLNQDGSGKLANGKISWDTDGNTVIDAEIRAKAIYLRACSDNTSEPDGSLAFNSIGPLPELAAGECRSIRLIAPRITRAMIPLTLTVANSNVVLFKGMDFTTKYSTIELGDISGCVFELYGFNRDWTDSNKTWWTINPLTSDSEQALND
jgi:hypothetical protein